MNWNCLYKSPQIQTLHMCTALNKTQKRFTLKLKIRIKNVINKIKIEKYKCNEINCICIYIKSPYKSLLQMCTVLN